MGEPGAEVMYAWRSFEAYPILCDLAAADSVRVPLRDQADAGPQPRPVGEQARHGVDEAAAPAARPSLRL